MELNIQPDEQIKWISMENGPDVQFARAPGKRLLKITEETSAVEIEECNITLFSK